MYHLWPMLFYLVLYLIWFHIVEAIPRSHYLAITLPADRVIPFLEIFVIPYMSWFLFVAIGITGCYFADRDTYDSLATSLMIGMTKMGVHFTIFAPKELWPEQRLVDLCRGYAEQYGSSVTISDQIECVEGADVIYTDVWASMGEEAKTAERVKLLRPYQVNAELMKKTGKETTIFLHCLPAVKGNEVTEEVFESPASLVFDEAENRMHTIKAVMVATLGEEDA